MNNDKKSVLASICDANPPTTINGQDIMALERFAEDMQERGEMKIKKHAGVHKGHLFYDGMDRTRT